jgi:hypothetical protein
LQLPPCRDGASEEEQTCDALEKGRPHIVLSLRALGRQELLSRPESTVHKKPREDEHARQQQDNEAGNEERPPRTPQELLGPRKAHAISRMRRSALAMVMASGT